LHFAADEGKISMISFVCYFKNRCFTLRHNAKIFEMLLRLNFAGHLNTVKALVNMMANLEVLDAKEAAPIHLAAGNGRCTSFFIVNSNSPPTHICDPTLFLFTVYKGHTDIVTHFVSIKPRLLFMTDKFGSTPLHRACYFGHRSTVEELIVKGSAYPNTHSEVSYACITDAQGDLAVHNACIGGWTDIVELMVKVCEIPVGVRGARGLSLLHVASESGKEECLSLY
jgi:ankyrin repeat protein